MPKYVGYYGRMLRRMVESDNPAILQKIEETLDLHDFFSEKDERIRDQLASSSLTDEQNQSDEERALLLAEFVKIISTFS